MTYRVLVTGSRDWTNRNTIRDAMFSAWYDAGRPEDITLVTGGCWTGADQMAEAIAVELEWSIDTYPALWSKYGAGAGPVRNKAMVASGADICLGFMRAHSRGTTHTVVLARAAGIPVRLITHGDDETEEAS